MVVYTGHYLELPKTFMLFQVANVPLWFAIHPDKDGNITATRLFIYEAIEDWLTAHRDRIMEIQKLIDKGETAKAVQKITDMLIEIDDAREVLTALAAIDRKRNVAFVILKGDVLAYHEPKQD